MLPPRLLDDLNGLVRGLGDQECFAEGAARWSRAAVDHVRADAPADGWSRITLPTREVTIRQLPERVDPGATSAPLRKDQRPAQESGGATATAAAAPSHGTHDAGYRAYTTAYDRVVNAATLASREELAQFRAKLDAELTSVRSVVARLAKRLLRVLMARQVREWRSIWMKGCWTDRG